VARRLRLDSELVRRGMVRSREQAATLIADGRIEVRGIRATKPATGVDPDTPLRILETDGEEYASRGGHKLAGALDTFTGLSVEGRRCLDAGASTGGFTDVLLRRGAKQVVAVDVGYGQLAWPLRSDQRVTVLDRTNVRTLTPDDIGGPADVTVADLSFISLGIVLPALTACTADDGDLVPMVKPQFEVGRERLPRGGVVRDPQLRRAAVETVAECARALGAAVLGTAPSALEGPSGNRETFLWLAEGDRPGERGEVRAW